MDRRNLLKMVGTGIATTAVVGGTATGQSEPVDGGGSAPPVPEVTDSDVGVSISSYAGTGDGGVDGITAHVDPNDNSRLMLSGGTLLQSDHRELEVYEVEVDDDAETVDVTLQFWKTDEANTNAAPGVGVRGGSAQGIQDGGNTRFVYKVYGYIEFDRDVSEYDFDV